MQSVEPSVSYNAQEAGTHFKYISMTEPLNFMGGGIKVLCDLLYTLKYKNRK